jgi:hypothetical protein
VLELIRNEGADMVIHLGDFDYRDDPISWDAQLTDVLCASFPLFAVVGNHELKRWDAYQHLLEERLGRVQDAACSGEYGVNAACRYQGIFFLLSGAGTLGSGHAAFIREALARDGSVWRICAWHKNQQAMQIGDKADSVGWESYEACRDGGAIIANGHDHNYARSRTLTDLQRRSLDLEWPDGDTVKIGAGSTFVVVSGLGGRSVQGQYRCYPARPPYGCNFEWATIYSATQEAQYGALFIDFNVDGDLRKARGYFKNVAGEIIDSFTILAQTPEGR